MKMYFKGNIRGIILGLTLWCFVLFLLGSGLTSCQVKKGSQLSTTQQSQNRNSLLWKIQSKESKNISYVFGTIHMIPKDKWLFNDKMQQAFDQCEEIIFEVDMNQLTDMSRMLEVLQMANMSGDTTLQDLLTTQDYEKVQNKLKESGMPIFLFEKMKPLFLTMFGGDMDMQFGNMDNMVSYEMKLNELATNQGKKTSGIETLEEQMSVVDKIPLPVQAQMLMRSFEDGASDSDDYQDMVQLYLDQNIDAMQESINDTNQLESKYMQYLLDDRNKRWINRIDNKIKSTTFFLAVGAGHLAGENGVLELLKKSGYKVTPVL